MALRITMTTLSFLVALVILQTTCQAVALHSRKIGAHNGERNQTRILDGDNGTFPDREHRRDGERGGMARRLHIVLEILRVQQGRMHMGNGTMPRHNKTLDDMVPRHNKTRGENGNSTCEEWRHELMHRLRGLATRQMHGGEFNRSTESHNRTRDEVDDSNRDESPSGCDQSRELLHLLRKVVLGKNCFPRGEHNGSFPRANMTRGEMNHTRGGPREDRVNGTGLNHTRPRGAGNWEHEVFRLLVDLAMREQGHQINGRRNESTERDGNRPGERNCEDKDDDDDDDDDDRDDDNDNDDDTARHEWREKLVRLLHRLASRRQRGREERRGSASKLGEEGQEGRAELRGGRTRQSGGLGGERRRPIGERRGDRTRPTGKPGEERTRQTGERQGEGSRPTGEPGEERTRPTGGRRGEKTRPGGPRGGHRG